jgi:hypothetical protein
MASPIVWICLKITEHMKMMTSPILNQFDILVWNYACIFLMHIGAIFNNLITLSRIIKITNENQDILHFVINFMEQNNHFLVNKNKIQTNKLLEINNFIFI